MDHIIKYAGELLHESVTKINALDKSYCIVGGWIPYIQFPDQHPGTKDVDILFHSGSKEEDLKEIIEHFLNDGYCISAKHDFQLLKKEEIGGRKYIFNIDLLHPILEKQDSDLFVDHLELELMDTYERVKKMRSIALPYAKHFFTQGLVTKLDYKGEKIPVLDNTGFILSKFPSARKTKRPRDIFDIYLILSNDSGVYEKLNALKEDSPFKPVIEDFTGSIEE